MSDLSEAIIVYHGEDGEEVSMLFQMMTMRSLRMLVV